MEENKAGIAENAVTDEQLMHLIILPMNYKGKKRKQESIRECVGLARQLQDKEKEAFALAGLLSFTDKIIDEETRKQIKEVLGMTQVGKMLMDEGRREGRQEEARKNARNLLKRGDSAEDVAEVLELPVETVKVWEKEFFALV